MEATIKIIFLALFGFGVAQSFVITSEKCKITDSNCSKQVWQKNIPYFAAGIPEFGIDVLDPFVMGDINLNVSGFQFGLTDVVTKGMKKIIIDEVKFDLDKKVLYFKMHTNVNLKGRYSADGNVFGQKFSGNGEIETKLKNFQLDLFLYYDIINIDGKDHLKIEKYKFDFDVIDNAHFNFTNMFNGNKELSDAALNFANDNWHLFSLAFGRPLIDVFTKKVVSSFNKYYKNVPLEDLFYS